MSSKVKSRFLLLGTGADQISAKTFVVGFTPTTIVPEQVGSEGDDRVSAVLKGIDTKLGQIAAGVVNFTDQYFSGNGSASRVTLSQNITPTTALDVFVNGIQQEEGVDWARDSASEEVIFYGSSGVESPFPAGSRIRVRTFSSNAAYTDEFYSGGASSQVLSAPIGDASRIDLYYTGVLMEEGVDWTRDTGANEVLFVGSPTTAATRIRVRIWS